MKIFINFFENYIFYYAVSLFILYIVLAISAFIAIRKYRKRNANNDEQLLLDSSNAPFVSVIAPAFNEEKTIVVSVKSLLSLNYPNFEVIIVNDGSKDNTLNLLIKEFDLAPDDYHYIEKIKTNSFKRLYRSKDNKYSNLIVIDKDNIGAKADALNAGINVSNYEHILCVDVDCVIERNALLKLVKSMMDSTTPVIGVGATLRMSNSCEVDVNKGVITQVKPPKGILPRFQEVEYLRSFLISRMGWSSFNSIPNISGALGLYKKKIILECGGYNTKTLAEDMDLVIRIASYMIETKQKYIIKYIPISGSWTEGPANLKVLGRQRSRWATGLAQVLVNHRTKIFNYKYKRIGLVVLPNNLFFEFLAPIIEVVGISYFLISLILGLANWPLLLFVLLFSCSFGLVLGSLAVLYDNLIESQYKRKRDNLKLFILPFVEPFVYHPLLLYFSLLGFVRYLKLKEVNWGTMSRKGYKESAEVIVTQN